MRNTAEREPGPFRTVNGDGEGGLSRYAGGHKLVPILLGLVTPFLVLLALDPGLLADIRLWALILLSAALIVATALFVTTIANPGAVVSAKFDPLSRRAEFVRAGTFADMVYTVPFARIVEVRLDRTFDDDGYRTDTPKVILTPREELVLPASVGPAQIEAIREVLGMNQQLKA